MKDNMFFVAHFSYDERDFTLYDVDATHGGAIIDYYNPSNSIITNDMEDIYWEYASMVGKALKDYDLLDYHQDEYSFHMTDDKEYLEMFYEQMKIRYENAKYSEHEDCKNVIEFCLMIAKYRTDEELRNGK